MKHYVQITYGIDSQRKVKTAVVAVDEKHPLINDYVEPAKKKLCEKLGYDENDIRVTGFVFMGDIDIIE